jgi:hypothetical protein
MYPAGHPPYTLARHRGMAPACRRVRAAPGQDQMGQDQTGLDIAPGLR